MKVIQTRRGTTTRDNEPMKDRKIKALRTTNHNETEQNFNESRHRDGEETGVKGILIVTFWGCRDVDAVNEIYCIPTHFHPFSRYIK